MKNHRLFLQTLLLFAFLRKFSIQGFIHRIFRHKNFNINYNKLQVKTLVIDNYDSYTYNLWQLIAEVNGQEPIVIFNDDYKEPWELLEKKLPTFDNIVISPGPGSPENENDFGICREAILNSNHPLLGVCLGHQGLGFFNGAKVSNAPEPMHGRLSKVFFIDNPLFNHISNGTEVVRYHSLIVEDPLPDQLQKLAWTDRGEIMALKHKVKPQFGIQFHPESIKTTAGKTILENFRDFTLQYSKQKSFRINNSIQKSISISKETKSKHPQMTKKTYVSSIKIELNNDELFNVFSGFYKDEENSFWLDSNIATPIKHLSELSKHELNPQISYMGSTNTNGSYFLKYFSNGQIEKIYSNGSIEFIKKDIFSYLNAQFQENDNEKREIISDFRNNMILNSDVNIQGGFYGYFGYELYKDIFSNLNSSDAKYISSLNSSSNTSIPDAFFIYPTEYLAYDHRKSILYIVSLDDNNTKINSIFKDRHSQIFTKLKTIKSIQESSLNQVNSSSSSKNNILLASKSEQEYLSDIQQCLDYIKAGESYEVCLTERFQGPILDKFQHSLDIYQILREKNKAPYSCYFHHKNFRSPDGFSISCTSPERFLKLDNRILTSKPIKGTCKRDLCNSENDFQLMKNLHNDEKSQAENLMIVDLVRNDLGKICEIESISVPNLMNVESYSTVHQLVSTIQGQLKFDKSIIDAIKASFPGGSMTGAPKLRTMRIICELEKNPRGIYSGAMGYLGLNGVTDLNIVIRTAITNNKKLTLGAGGAILALSDPKEELDEVFLKANSVASSLGYTVSFRNNSEVGK